MSFAPLWASDVPIAAHAIAAILALALGIAQLVSEKGTLQHRILGRIWVLAMGFVAISSFFIYELQLLGPLSPIHILSVVVVYYLFVGVRAARLGNKRLHRRVMKSLFWFSLVLTGWFTLLPGRVMYQVVFGS